MNRASESPTGQVAQVIGCSHLRSIEERVKTPVFIYSERQLSENVESLKAAAAAVGLDKRIDIYVPFFPNSNPHVLRSLRNAGVGILLQMPSEYELLRRFDFDKFIVSTGHIPDRDISFWALAGYPMFLSSLDEVEYLLENHAGTAVNVRFDNLNSAKPGIRFSELKALSRLLATRGRDLNCFELYCGSGNSADDMIVVVKQVLNIFRNYFPKVTAINFAGGFGYSYGAVEGTRRHFDWGRYFASLRELATAFKVPETVRFIFEPARDLLADVGVLLLGVERRLIRYPESSRLLTNGSRVLMPSAQYKNRQHHVVFLDADMREIMGDRVTGALRGRSILRNDYVLPGDYKIPEGIGPGDFVLILDAGAYCATQHMEFLNIPPAAEVLIDANEEPHLITAHGASSDKWRYLLPEPQKL